MDDRSAESQAQEITCPRCGRVYAQAAYCPHCGYGPSGFSNLTPTGAAQMEGSFIGNLIRMAMDKLRGLRR